MKLHPISHRKKKHRISLFIVLFFVFFGITINNINFQYVFTMFGFAYFGCLYRKYRIPRSSIRIVLFFLCIILYASFIMLYHGSKDYFEIFRFFRCIASTLFLSIVITQYDVSPRIALQIVRILFLIHAISVIACVFIPELNEVLIPISNHTKSFHTIRSSGLVSGEDAAGYLCVIGMIIEIIDRISKKKKPLSLVLMIFVASTAFTSRFTMVIATLIICGTIIYLVKHDRIVDATSLWVIIVPIFILAVVLVILTTPFAYGLKGKLLTSFPVVNKLYQMTEGSYLDYSKYSSAVYRHVSITDLSIIDIIFGVGRKSDVEQDAGYIKTIYSVGVVGLVAIVAFHLGVMIKARQLGKSNRIYMVVAHILSLIILVSLVWELKYSFLFSSTFYETIILIYISLIHCKDKYGDLYGDSSYSFY